jgi:hypothetical protein
MESRQRISNKIVQFIKTRFPENVGFPVLLLLSARLISLITSPLDGLLGYGDFQNFIQLARLPGWPFINYWVEYPPVFPFINTILFRLAGGKEATYYYILAFLLLLVDFFNLFLFIKIINQVHGIAEGRWRILSYLIVLVAVPYTWWEFDPLAVLGLLLGLYFLFRGHDKLASSAIAFGVLVKLFPIILLIIPWRFYSKVRALKITLFTIGIVAIVYGALILASPAYSLASIRSQVNKGSWETVWALIDGNIQTGLFGSFSQRVNPEIASAVTRNPPVINPILSLFAFGGLGLWAFLKVRIQTQQQMIAFVGMAFCLLFLWLPGWSPQWVLLLVPVLLLSLPMKEGGLLCITLILVNLLEWPVLLSRGLFNDLWVTVLLRTLVLSLAGWTFFQEAIKKKRPDQQAP